jgi:hypothetical protein
MMRTFYLFCLLAPLMLTACTGGLWGRLDSAPPRLVDEYTPPESEPLTSTKLSITIDKPLAQVKELLAAYLGHPQSAWVVADSTFTEEESGPLRARLLLALPQPEECLDCGSSSFSYYDGESLSKQWQYPTASGEIKMEFSPEDVLTRYMELSGQAILTVIPLGTQRTEIKILVEYSLEHKATAYARRRQGGQTIIVPLSAQTSARFNSLQTGNLEETIECLSKGQVETAILNDIAQALQ